MDDDVIAGFAGQQFRLDNFRIIRFFGILLGLAGLLLVLLPEASLPTPEMVGWVALGLVAPLCYALNAICVAMLRPPEGDSVQLAGGNHDKKQGRTGRLPKYVRNKRHAVGGREFVQCEAHAKADTEHEKDDNGQHTRILRVARGCTAWR